MEKDYYDNDDKNNNEDDGEKHEWILVSTLTQQSIGR